MEQIIDIISELIEGNSEVCLIFAFAPMLLIGWIFGKKNGGE